LVNLPSDYCRLWGRFQASVCQIRGSFELIFTVNLLENTYLKQFQDKGKSESFPR
jgi:hypothetical protein